jgi:hypothetical protein
MVCPTSCAICACCIFKNLMANSYKIQNFPVPKKLRGLCICYSTVECPILGSRSGNRIFIVVVKITEIFQKKLNFFSSKMDVFKPLVLLKYSSKARFNHWIMCHISQWMLGYKKVETSIRIKLVVVRYVDILHFTSSFKKREKWKT